MAWYDWITGGVRHGKRKRHGAHRPYTRELKAKEEKNDANFSQGHTSTRMELKETFLLPMYEIRYRWKTLKIPPCLRLYAAIVQVASIVQGYTPHAARPAIHDNCPGQ